MLSSNFPAELRLTTEDGRRFVSLTRRRYAPRPDNWHARSRQARHHRAISLGYRLGLSDGHGSCDHGDDCDTDRHPLRLIHELSAKHAAVDSSLAAISAIRHLAGTARNSLSSDFTRAIQLSFFPLAEQSDQA